jgi:hypothetical protein
MSFKYDERAVRRESCMLGVHGFCRRYGVYCGHILISSPHLNQLSILLIRGISDAWIMHVTDRHTPYSMSHLGALRVIFKGNVT